MADDVVEADTDDSDSSAEEVTVQPLSLIHI